VVPGIPRGPTTIRTPPHEIAKAKAKYVSSGCVLKKPLVVPALLPSTVFAIVVIALTSQSPRVSRASPKMVCAASLGCRRET
jgi:hypothetical protein